MLNFGHLQKHVLTTEKADHFLTCPVARDEALATPKEKGEGPSMAWGSQQCAKASVRKYSIMNLFFLTRVTR